MARSLALAASALVLLGVPSSVAPASGAHPASAAPMSGVAGGRSIALAGVSRDQPDLLGLRLGRAGYWFPQFDAPRPVSGRPTGERVRPRLPVWVAPLNHAAAPTDLGCTPAEILGGCLPTFLFRSFSQDGPARSAGGHPAWSELRLPNGNRGLSGAIGDPHTRANVNNTINRIQLRDGVPATFDLSVVTDNTAGRHDPTRALVARGNAGPLDTDATQIEPGSAPGPGDLVFNGVPDVYTFRFAGFRAGDYVKLRLGGDASTVGGASFGGLLFDRSLARER